MISRWEGYQLILVLPYQYTAFGISNKHKKVTSWKQPDYLSIFGENPNLNLTLRPKYIKHMLNVISASSFFFTIRRINDFVGDKWKLSEFRFDQML